MGKKFGRGGHNIKLTKHYDNAALEAELTPDVMDALENYAYSIAHFDQTVADDLFEETLFKCARSYDTFRHECDFKTWAYRIMHNTNLERVQINKRLQGVSIDELSEEAFPSAARCHTDDIYQQEILSLIGDAYEAAEIAQKNGAGTPLRALQVLGEVLAGDSYEESAEKHSIPLGTVRSDVFRAKKTLKTLLKRVEQGKDNEHEYMPT